MAPTRRTLVSDPEMMLEMASLKPTSRASGVLETVRSFPKPVRVGIGRALQFAQAGSKHPKAKALKGFAGASVLEIVEDHTQGTYRAVYTVRFKDAVYVLHAFQKKSKHGIATPQRDIDLVKERLKWAEQQTRRWPSKRVAPTSSPILGWRILTNSRSKRNCFAGFMIAFANAISRNAKPRRFSASTNPKSLLLCEATRQDFR